MIYYLKIEEEQKCKENYIWWQRQLEIWTI